MLFMFACVYWCPTHIVLCFCFVFVRLVCHMLPVSLECLITVSDWMQSKLHFPLDLLYLCVYIIVGCSFVYLCDFTKYWWRFLWIKTHSCPALPRVADREVPSSIEVADKEVSSLQKWGLLGHNRERPTMDHCLDSPTLHGH